VDPGDVCYVLSRRARLRRDEPQEDACDVGEEVGGLGRGWGVKCARIVWFEVAKSQHAVR
jgi:hypothetical protein